MSKEIERKFLVNDSWRDYPILFTHSIIQVYLTTDPSLPCVRVRAITNIEKAFMTIKTKTESMFVREEVEFPFEYDKAIDIIRAFMGSNTVAKERYEIDAGGRVWSIDRFKSPNSPLVLAEIELLDENEELFLPNFIGKEVTEDPRFLNCNLATNPYRTDWIV